MGGDAVSKTKPQVAYLVRRVAMDAGGEVVMTGDYPDRSRVPLRAFADKSKAEAERDRLLAVARRTVNPFALMDSVWLEFYTTRSDDFLATLDSLNVPRPPDEVAAHGDIICGRELTRWWDTTAPNLSDAQRDAVWALLDKLAVYDVAEIELEG